jgi:hypothetical protein
MNKVKSDKEAMRIFQLFGNNQWDLISMYLGHRLDFGIGVHDAYAITLVVYGDILSCVRMKKRRK